MTKKRVKVAIIGFLALLIAMPSLAFAEEAAVISESEVIADTAETEVSDAELAADTVTALDSSDTLRFILTAKWGFVRGNPDLDKTLKDYSGSIAATNYENAKLKVVNKLLWERHDAIITPEDLITWTSKIYGHWDGVRVAVAAKASETITVTTVKGNVAKTAQEWFNLAAPEVVDLGNNEMLVVKIHKAPRLRKLALVWWGVNKNPTEPADDTDVGLTAYPIVDFSGSLTMDSGSYTKLSRTLRFEKHDAINEHDRNGIDWTSKISTGRDGMAAFFLPAKDAGLTSGFTLSFPSLETPWTQHYSFEDLVEGIYDTFTIGDIEYMVRAGRKNIVKQLVRAKRSGKLFMVNGNVRHEVPSTDLLTANGLDDETITEMPDEELEAFELGEDLDYPDGTVIEESGEKHVIVDGARRRMAAGKVATKVGKRRLLKKIGKRVLAKYQEAPAITSEEELPEGSLVTTEDDSAVWMIRGGKRQIFRNSKMFELHDKKFGNVQTVSTGKLQAYDWATPVKYPDGALVKVTTDPKVYLIDDGRRHWVETEEDFNGMGFEFDDIVDMPDTEFTNYGEGEPIIADELTDIVEY